MDVIVRLTLNKDEFLSSNSKGKKAALTLEAATQTSEFIVTENTTQTDEGLKDSDGGCPKAIFVPKVESEDEDLPALIESPDSSDEGRDSPNPRSTSPERKRPLEELNTENEERPKKKAKRSVQEQFILPWFAGCESKCEICGQLFFYNQELRKHIKEEHEHPNDYLDRFSSFETKEVFLKCKICQQDMKRSYSGIKQHLSQKHPELDHLAYQTKFKLFNYRLIKRDESEESYITFKNFQDFAQGSCLYDCPVCDYSCSKDEDFWKHVAESHGVEHRAAFINTHGDSCIIQSKLWCAVDGCYKLVLHEPEAIKRHLTAKHDSMSMEKYYDDYYDLSSIEAGKGSILPYSQWINQCLYKCEICEQEFNSHGEMSDHLADIHSLSIAQYKESHKDLFSRKTYITCNECQERVLCTSQRLKNHAIKTHGMTLKSYYKRIVQKPLETSAQSADFSTGGSAAVASSNWGDSDWSTSRWSDRCEYQCKICLKNQRTEIFHKYAQLFNHVANYHKVSMRKYKKDYPGDLITKRLDFQCPKCNKNMFWRERVLLRHAVFHGIGIDQLRKAYEQGQQQQPQPSTSSGFGTHFLAADSEIPSTSTQPAQPAKQTVPAQYRTLFLDWKYGCEYNCRECDYKCRQAGTLQTHLSQQHKISRVAYVAKYKSIRTTTVMHTCKLCGKSMLQDNTPLTGHIGRHGKSLEEYFCQHVMTGEMAAAAEKKRKNEWMNRNEFKCGICNDFQHKLKREFFFHITIDHDVNSYDEYLADRGDPELTSIRFRCKKCDQTMNHDEYDIKEHLDEKHQMTPEVYYDLYKAKVEAVKDHVSSQRRRKSTFDWDQCRYECLSCGKVAKRLPDISKHIKTLHPERCKLPPQEKYSRATLEHGCLICNKSVIFERINLNQHLNTVSHSFMSLDDYEKRFEPHLRALFAGLDAAKAVDTASSSSSSHNNSASPTANNEIDYGADLNMDEFVDAQIHESSVIVKKEAEMSDY